MQAEADATNAIEKVVKDWVDGAQEDLKSSCTDVSANAVVDGVAEAVAKVFTTVQTSVRKSDSDDLCNAPRRASSCQSSFLPICNDSDIVQRGFTFFRLPALPAIG